MNAREVAKEAVEVHGAYQDIAELAALWELARRLMVSKQAVLEIGVARGGTLWAWTQLPTRPLVVGIDLPGGSGLGTVIEPPTGAHLIYGSSQEVATAAAVVDALNGRRIGLLFIDGDHTEAAVRRDYETYSPLVAEGGLIAFHDIRASVPRFAEVDRFWSQLPGLKLEILTRPHGARGIGVLLV